jgi:hypothetical protein
MFWYTCWKEYEKTKIYGSGFSKKEFLDAAKKGLNVFA